MLGMAGSGLVELGVAPHALLDTDPTRPPPPNNQTETLPCPCQAPLVGKGGLMPHYRGVTPEQQIQYFQEDLKNFILPKVKDEKLRIEDRAGWEYVADLISKTVDQIKKYQSAPTRL